MGWNGSDQGSTPQQVRETPVRKGRGVLRHIVIIFGTLVIASLVWLFLRDGNNGMAKGPSDGKKKAGIEAVASKAQGGSRLAEVIPASSNATVRAVATNAVVQGGSTSVVAKVEKTDKPKKKTPFSTGTEQLMSWIFNAKPGKTMPPLLRISPAEAKNIAGILMSKNPVLEGDSEETAEGKKMVEHVKKEMIEYLKQGGKAEDFLSYYHGELVKAYNERKDAQKIVLESLREDPAVGLELAAEVNKRLAEKGIEPVIIPPKYRK